MSKSKQKKNADDINSLLIDKSNSNIRQSISLPTKKEEEAKAKAEADKKAKKTYSLWDFTKFTLPYLWRGGWAIRAQTVLTFVLLILSRTLNVTHPLILKMAIDNITCYSSVSIPYTVCEDTDYTYFLIAMYVGTRFMADFVNYIREIPFASISASAEIFIAHKVYTHIQSQSLAFHLSRETGKIIRIVSRGSQSFASILRMALFNLVPLIFELILVMVVIFKLYPATFFFIILSSVVVYITATICITEWRAKYFKSMATKDTEYIQKATDSLLNFETVKYFNAEEHEEHRFLKALQDYKKENVIVARSMTVLNISQAGIISIGLVISLLLAFKKIVDIDDHGVSEFNVGDFVMINMYILQIYGPLNFLGTMWRFIRQAMTDVELVFELLEIDESIKEPRNPLPPSITKGEIEFRDVSFTYDKKMAPGDQKMII